MGIWLSVTIWMLLAGVFVLAICSAAARPTPKPVDANVEEQESVNSKTEMQAPQAIKLAHMTALAALLAVLTTSCAVTSPNHSVNKGSSEPVKGATLLMDHSR
jgi:Na+/proline symporter